jgi:hypothetical protein
MLPDDPQARLERYISQKRNHFKQNGRPGIEARPKAC